MTNKSMAFTIAALTHDGFVFLKDNAVAGVKTAAKYTGSVVKDTYKGLRYGNPNTTQVVQRAQRKARRVRR